MLIKKLKYKLLSKYGTKTNKEKYINQLQDLMLDPITKKCRSCLDFEFYADTKTYKFIDYMSIDCRNISTIKMISIAMQRIRNNLTKNFKIKVVTGDFTPDSNKKIWAYSKYKNSEKTNVELIPDFIFDGWDSIGCKNFDIWMEQMVENSLKKPEFNQIFWSGAMDMNPIRLRYNEFAQNDNRISCIPVLWKRENWIAGQEIENNRTLTLVDFPKYKYLIDLPCAGYSGRFKALLFSGRPVFKVEDNFEEFFYKDLRPFEHFIPVKNDLSDLIEKLDWAENNYNKALLIAKNAQNYALKNLTFEACIKYFEKLIKKIGQ